MCINAVLDGTASDNGKCLYLHLDGYLIVYRLLENVVENKLIICRVLIAFLRWELRRLSPVAVKFIVKLMFYIESDMLKGSARVCARGCGMSDIKAISHL